MRIRAIGRQLLVRLDFDLLDAVRQEQEADRKIIIPDEVIEKLHGGCQISTVLSVGESAFDDEPPSVQEMNWVGRQIITARYPGHGIDLDPYSSDARSQRTRMISCGEVHAVIAEDDEEGADV